MSSFKQRLASFLQRRRQKALEDAYAEQRGELEGPGQVREIDRAGQASAWQSGPYGAKEPPHEPQ